MAETWRVKCWNTSLITPTAIAPTISELRRLPNRKRKQRKDQSNGKRRNHGHNPHPRMAPVTFSAASKPRTKCEKRHPWPTNCGRLSLLTTHPFNLQTVPIPPKTSYRAWRQRIEHESQQPPVSRTKQRCWCHPTMILTTWRSSFGSVSPCGSLSWTLLDKRGFGERSSRKK